MKKLITIFFLGVLLLASCEIEPEYQTTTYYDVVYGPVYAIAIDYIEEETTPSTKMAAASVYGQFAIQFAKNNNVFNPSMDIYELGTTNEKTANDFLAKSGYKEKTVNYIEEIANDEISDLIRYFDIYAINGYKYFIYYSKFSVKRLKE